MFCGLPVSVFDFFLSDLIFVCCAQVIDHYENPRNVGKLDAKKKNVGTGLVGAPACGDVMRLQIEVQASIPYPNPDPDPGDPHVFGPSGSGFTSQRYGSGSGSSIIKQK